LGQFGTVMIMILFLARDSIIIMLSVLYARPPACLSVRLSVRRVDHRKTVERSLFFSPSPFSFSPFLLSIPTPSPVLEVGFGGVAAGKFFF